MYYYVQSWKINNLKNCDLTCQDLILIVNSVWKNLKIIQLETNQLFFKYIRKKEILNNDEF